MQIKRNQKSSDSRIRSKTGLFSRLLRHSGGNTLAMAGMALVPITAMIGSGLDMSRGYMAKARMQSACDAAALAARRNMSGTTLTNAAEAEGERFFDFNFPEGTMQAENLTVSIDQPDSSSTELVISASADIPTAVMDMFGREYIPVSVECNADFDMGHNDIMLVLDVTGSMNSTPSGGSTRKIQLLRNAAGSLYDSLSGSDGSRTRFGIMPYSVTVNVGGELRVRDVLRNHYFWTDEFGDWELEQVRAKHSTWAAGTNPDAIRQWQRSGDACIEERPTYGNSRNNGVFEIETTVSQDDIDQIAPNGASHDLQWAWYDEGQYDDFTWGVCPAPATRLTEYGSRSTFDDAIDDATATVGGNTYHDIGMVWAMRFLSTTGMFDSDNDLTYDDDPVRQHIIFLTDGIIATTSSGYTAYGVNSADGDDLDDRIQYTFGSRNQAHVDRFLSACEVAKEMGMTVWVIALDVSYTSDIEGCATDDNYFYQSDGSDLGSVFATIGQNIGRLRLTR